MDKVDNSHPYPMYVRKFIYYVITVYLKFVIYLVMTAALPVSQVLMIVTHSFGSIFKMKSLLEN